MWLLIPKCCGGSENSWGKYLIHVSIFATQKITGLLPIHARCAILPGNTSGQWVPLVHPVSATETDMLWLCFLMKKFTKTQQPHIVNTVWQVNSDSMYSFTARPIATTLCNNTSSQPFWGWITCQTHLSLRFILVFCRFITVKKNSSCQMRKRGMFLDNLWILFDIPCLLFLFSTLLPLEDDIWVFRC